jgi:putative ABC transport system permease protein
MAVDTVLVMRGFGQDLRYALRGLRKNPSFTLVAMVTLALGIGANTAVFSVLNAVLLRPLPYRAPEQLATLWSEIPTQGLREGRSAYGDVDLWRSATTTFSDIAVSDSVRLTLSGPGGAEQISVNRVSPNMFSLLGIQPSHGRVFTSDEANQRQRLALISHRFWQTRLGGSFDAIGSTIVLDRVPSRIIGILPPELQLDTNDVWEPHTLYANWDQLRVARGNGFWSVVGRLRPGVTFDQAQAEMNAIARRLDEQSPLAGARGISVVPLSQQVTGSTTRTALWMLTGAVSFVLLMAIANVAGLSLARSAGRDREIAIRSALGASQAHILRQLVVESLTLAVLAGVASLAVALVCIRLIVLLDPGGIARLDEVRLDPWAFGWALVVSIIAGLLMGLAPAITTMRRNLKPAFQEGGRGASGSATARRIRRVLVVGEFALAIVLLVGAGLLTRSLLNVQNVDSGFSTDRVVSLQLASPVYPTTAQRVNYFERVLEQARAVPGVERAAIASEFFIGGSPEQAITVEGSTRGLPERVRVRRDEITPDFFDTVGTPLLRGRLFTAADGANAPRVAIINDQMARRLWPGQDAVGRRFKFGGAAVSTPWFTVVGVVADMRRQGPEQAPASQMFEALAQNPSRLVTLLVRTSADPQHTIGAVQAAARQVEKDAPVYGATTLDERLARFNAQRRFQTSLLMSFAVVALLLAAVGIYGLIRYSIATRRREISIRIAVGAQRSDIIRMILREALSLSLIGLALGLAGATWLGRLLSGLVFGVTATDMLTFVAVSVLFTGVAMIASYLPARLAARIDPLAGLKYE